MSPEFITQGPYLMDFDKVAYKVKHHFLAGTMQDAVGTGPPGVYVSFDAASVAVNVAPDQLPFDFS